MRPVVLELNDTLHVTTPLPAPLRGDTAIHAFVLTTNQSGQPPTGVTLTVLVRASASGLAEVGVMTAFEHGVGFWKTVKN